VSIDRATLSHLRHELHTPLNHIIGYSEMLLEDAAEDGNAALEPGLRRVREEARRLLSLVDDFLGQARVEAGEVDLGRLAAETAGPLDAVVATVDALKRQAAQAGAAGPIDDLHRIGAAAAALRSMITGGVVQDAALTSRSASVASAAATPPVPAETGVILIVDDNAENREMLGRRLAREGHQAVLADGGRAALALLRKQPIDLVLLDVMMPDMDGYQVLQQLKADPAMHDLPVLMISALDELESVVRCIELGAEDYLPKPFDPVLLRARIGACLEKKRLRDREVEHLRQLAEWNEKLERRVAEQVALVERLGRLKRFFSPQLAELIVAGGADDPLKTHRREVTVCFLDLRGFTAFAEAASPEEVMSVLREYHAEMGRLILEHEGTLERFTGDGMMIFFNDPVPVPNATERTVRMALAMRERVAALRDKWHKLGYELALGIGIAQGYATIGAIGFEGRWDYGAIGSVTNLAARLCSEAKAGQILISRRVLTAVEELLEVEPAGELTLKGFQRPITACNVVGLRG
jgi:class 3 adenylate cyclase/CheY-like chemotaxis protein